MKGQAKIGLLVVLGLFVVLGGCGVGSYNKLVRAHEAIPSAWSQVENVMQRRNDLIPNLVNTVKGFAKQEKSIYEDVSKALQSFGRAQTVSEKLSADNSITGALSRIMSVAIQYPKLQSNENFMRLQDELAGTENRISVERKSFNEVVQNYNQMVKTFPSNLVAKIGGLKASEDYFKAEEAAKTAPKVSFE